MTDLVVDGLSVDGDGVARSPEGRVIFIPRAIPGDRVRVQLSQIRKGVQFAELQEVLEPSPDRVASRCLITECGACALKCMSLEGQARAKRERVLAAMQRIGKLDVAGLLGPAVQLGDGWRYRIRVRFHAERSSDGWALGYFQPHSHRLVPFGECPVLSRGLAAAACAFDREITSLPAEAFMEQVEIAHSEIDDRHATVVHGAGDLLEYRRSLTWYEQSGAAGVRVQNPSARWQQGNLDLRYPHARSQDFQIRFEPGLFAQAFPGMNDRLVAEVVAGVRPADRPRVLELHAGVGNFTLPLSLNGANVTAVERDRRAAILGRRNASDAGVAVEILDGSDAEFMDRLDRFDVVLLDPPRTGAKSVCEALAHRGPGRVVYVACDSATFARDSVYLTRGGYDLTSLLALDMFPQTAHVETVAVFQRRT